MKRKVLSICLAVALGSSCGSISAAAADGSGSGYMEVTETQESEVISDGSDTAASGAESGDRPMIGGSDGTDTVSSDNMGGTTGGSAQPGKTSRIVKVTKIRTIKTGGTSTVKNKNVASSTKSASTKKKTSSKQSTAKKSPSTAKKTSSTGKSSKKSTKKKSSKK